MMDSSSIKLSVVTSHYGKKATCQVLECSAVGVHREMVWNKEGLAGF